MAKCKVEKCGYGTGTRMDAVYKDYMHIAETNLQGSGTTGAFAVTNII